MSKEKIEFRCWKCSNLVTFFIPKKEHNKFIQKFEDGKRVCPNCKPYNELMICVESPMLICKPKTYKCKNGHLTTISVFGDGNLCINHGPDAEHSDNFGRLENIDHYIQNGNIICEHMLDEFDACFELLQECDDYKLLLPTAPNIKTKTRVGDIWDKANVPDSKLGNYDSNGVYRETTFEKRNRERLSRMRRERVIPLDKLPGREIIENPTNRRYNKNAKRPRKFDL